MLHEYTVEENEKAREDAHDVMYLHTHTHRVTTGSEFCYTHKWGGGGGRLAEISSKC